MNRYQLPKHDFYHIGYHKTATKLLKRHVFPQLRPEMDEAGLSLLSRDGLSGSLFEDDLTAPKEIAAVNPKAKIIICIRSQYTILRSMYWLYVKSSGHLTYAEFVKKAIDGQKFFYLDMADRYAEAFSPDNVLILLYEDLLSDRDRFVQRLIDFIGIKARATSIAFPRRPVNPTPSDGYIEFTRHLNHLPYKSSYALTKLGRAAQYGYLAFEKAHTKTFGRKSRRYDYDACNELIEQAYTEQNTLLADRYGLDLARAHYPGTETTPRLLVARHPG